MDEENKVLDNDAQPTDEKMLNEEALDLLDEAMFLSSLITDKERKKGRVEDWDSVYPTNREETERMEQLLDEAEKVVEDPSESAYAERYKDLREVVDWSKKRHRSWTWKLIAGALVGAGIFYYFENDKQDDIARAKADVAAVQAWTPADVSVSAQSVSSDYHNSHYSGHFDTPKAYKTYKLSYIKNQIEYSIKSAKEFQARADTASTEERKENYLKQKTHYEEYSEKQKVLLDSVAALDYEQLKDYALGEVNRWEESEQNTAKNLHNFMIYLFILIPLYIISGYPRGYTLTGTRRSRGCLTAFRKIGFGLASIFFGTGLAMSLLPDEKVKYQYAYHTETRTETNSGNFVILGLKFILMVIGAFIFAFVASFIMTLETILGLKRNFEWGALFRKLTAKKAQ